MLIQPDMLTGGASRAGGATSGASRAHRTWSARLAGSTCTAQHSMGEQCGLGPGEKLCA